MIERERSLQHRVIKSQAKQVVWSGLELGGEISEVSIISTTDITENSSGSESEKPLLQHKRRTKLVEQDQLILVGLCVQHQQEFTCSKTNRILVINVNFIRTRNCKTS